MIEGLKAKVTLRVSELQDGDIVCFQRVHERKPMLGLGAPRDM
jgi:ubiquitin carboxyl-terminal hydrolase 7